MTSTELRCDLLIFVCTDKHSRNVLESAFGSVLPDMFMRNPAKIYLFKVNNTNIRKRSEICSKLRIKTPE